MYGDNRQSIIVVGVDGSGESLVAAHWAAKEALRRRYRLRLVHGYTDPSPRYPGYVLPMGVTRELHNTAQQVLDVAAQSISVSFPHVELATGLVNADPRRVLVDASAGAVLTVIGNRGRGRVPEVLLGSVALHVAAHGRSPVAVVPSDTILSGDRSAGPILLGVDASASCSDAVGYAFGEADSRGVDVIAALVVDDTTVPPFLRGPARAGSIEDEEERRTLATRLAGWPDKYPSVGVRHAVLHGRPARALLDHGLGLTVGDHPSMVVIGGRGRSGLTGFLLGSTGQSLITQSVWPVVIVRPGVVRHPGESTSATATRVESLASAE